MPIDESVLADKFKDNEIDLSAKYIFMNSRHKDISFELYSDNELGKFFIGIKDNRTDLDTINTAINVYNGLTEKEKEELLNGNCRSYGEFFRKVKSIQEKEFNIEKNYYFPLEIYKWSDYFGEDVIIPPEYKATEYIDYIKKAVESEMDDCCSERMMMKYWNYDDEINKKVHSLEWDVEENDGRLYGIVRAVMNVDLTASEEEKLKDYILGQNSDGLGEGFEQRPIKTSDGEIYVKFWQDNNYFICNDEEFEKRIYNGLELGGM